MSSKQTFAFPELMERLQVMVRERVQPPQTERVARFVHDYYGQVPEEVLEERDLLDLYGAALAHWGFARCREAKKALVRVYNPVLEEHGWECPHTVVEIVDDDMPFMVDSVRMALNRFGLQVLRIIHPVIHVRRDTSGELLELFGRDEVAASQREAVIHLELVRQADSRLLARIQSTLEQVLKDIRSAVLDWEAMHGKLQEIIGLLTDQPPNVLDSQELEEGLAFLHWMADHHFTFLGYRAYDLVGDEGAEALRAVAGSGLGILREAGADNTSQAFAGLPPELRREARSPSLLVISKSSTVSTVHRPANLDYVGIKRFDQQGRVVGEHRLLGLYGSRAYSGIPQKIPILRRKIEQVMQRANLEFDSHSGKALQHILESHPRDELFQTSVEDLYRIGLGVLQLGENQRTRLFLRQDPYGRFMICLVYAPRERYDTHVRQRMQRILRDAFNGEEEVEFSVTLTESPLARIVFTVHTHPGEIPDHDAREIEARLVDAILSWDDRLHGALLEHLGEERGSALFTEYCGAFPAGYREDFAARSAVRDIEQMERLGPAEELRMSLYRPLEAAPGQLRFKVFRFGRCLPLSQALPMLENMGVRVGDERPYRIERAGMPPLWVHDFGLSHVGREAADTADIRALFQDAFAHAWHGKLADDSFNALVLKAHLNWRQVSLLRAYAKYLRQTAMAFSQPYMEEAMNANPDIARQLVELFEARFSPTRRKQAQQRVARLVTQIQDTLDAVQSLDQDRILRSFLAVVQATLRTNYYQNDAKGKPKERIAFKLDPAQVAELPDPRPAYEIFVYSPQVEGVHLRGGKVARGGLRWSDRREDFRTEILGLMKAQLVKNAVIVPVGAKGGFVIKQPPASGDREALQREVVACYRQFIGGLLDLTDNLAGEHILPPAELVRYDGDDPYLVVAADKGTATFSDIANEVAAGYNFWLGDAFASGGRAGYDHKKMGITARGAWESVRQHFRAAGLDYEHQPFSVVGVGDMSGDVFGNGLLWSGQTRLLAAFDHRHIFIDPDPDPQLSFAERRRLFELPSSSWADYDASLISAGGGVYPRTLKSIRLSDQACTALGINSHSLTPADLIRALLKAPVDLLWNGGIGTYVKASWERHTEVGDRVNDAVRINGRELRCRVVGEGGNLGLTQAARIEYALQGGRLDSDFIHNAGGVNCSDHEVNIKILLDRVVADGDMTGKQRDRLLQQMTDEVADLVLKDSYWQTCAIGLDEQRVVALLPEHSRFMRRLEQTGHLDRTLEFLPDEETLAERQASGRGLTRPEIALLVSYAKHTLYQELLDSDLPEDPCMAPELERYFPAPIRERFVERIHDHRLRWEILSSTVANRLINRMGSTFVFRLQEELGVSGAAVARAYDVVWEVFELRRLWSAVSAMEATVAHEVRIDILNRAVQLAGRACRWLLRSNDERIGVAELMDRYHDKLEILARNLLELLDTGRREAINRGAEPLRQAGVAEDLALQVAALDCLYSGLDLVEVSDTCQVPVEDAARVYFGLGAALELDWLAARFSALPNQDRWHASARASLRDDLNAHHRSLCEAVLCGAMAGTSAESGLEAWRHQHHAALERHQRLFDELKGLEEVDLAMLTVALREVQRLAVAADGRG